MDRQTFFNSKYLTLCQQLGDAQIKLDQLNQHIESLKAQIKTLDSCFPLVVESDRAVRAAKADRDSKSLNSENTEKKLKALKND